MTLGEKLKENINTTRNKILKNIRQKVTSLIHTGDCKVQISISDVESEVFVQQCSQYRDLIAWCGKENLVLDHRGHKFTFTPRRNIDGPIA